MVETGRLKDCRRDSALGLHPDWLHEPHPGAKLEVLFLQSFDSASGLVLGHTLLFPACRFRSHNAPLYVKGMEHVGADLGVRMRGTMTDRI